MVAGVLQYACLLEHADKAGVAAPVGTGMEFVGLGGKCGDENTPPQFVVPKNTSDQKTRNDRGVVAGPVVSTQKSAGFGMVKLVGGCDKRTKHGPLGVGVLVFKPMKQAGEKVGRQPRRQDKTDPVKHLFHRSQPYKEPEEGLEPSLPDMRPGIFW